MGHMATEEGHEIAANWSRFGVHLHLIEPPTRFGYRAMSAMLTAQEARTLGEALIAEAKEMEHRQKTEGQSCEDST